MNRQSERNRLLRKYNELKKTLGRTPTITEYFRVVGFINYRLDAIFGKPGWSKMLREVGDTPGQWTRGKIGKEHLLDHYIKLKKKLRRQPTYREYYRETGHADTVIGRYFGKPAWRSMLSVMNEQPLDRLRLDPSTRKVMLNDYMQLKEKLGRQPVSREYVAHTKHAMHRLNMVFGKRGWGKLVQAAGDKINRGGRATISCKHLIDHFNSLKSRLKRMPTYDEYAAHAKHYQPTMARCFGRPGWKGLVRASEKGKASKKSNAGKRPGRHGSEVFLAE